MSKKQGINGPIFALIAYDSGDYEIPENKDAKDQVTRQKLIDYILSKEINKGESNAGGWALSGNNPDPDITFMAIQSLAKYTDQKEVKEAVDRALKIMSKAQLSTGGFDSWGVPNCESTAQAIVALTALGIDIDNDSRFVKTDSKAILIMQFLSGPCLFLRGKLLTALYLWIMLGTMARIAIQAMTSRIMENSMGKSPFLSLFGASGRMRIYGL